MKTSGAATAAIILPFGGRPITTKAMGVATEADYCPGPRGLAGMVLGSLHPLSEPGPAGYLVTLTR